MNNTYIQVLVGGILVVLLLSLSDTVPLWMPDMTQMTVLLIVTLLLGIWASYIMYEQVTDEREAAYNLQTGRISYLTGVSVLLLALLIQGFAYVVDPWIPITLAVMVVVKIATKLYALWYR